MTDRNMMHIYCKFILDHRVSDGACLIDLKLWTPTDTTCAVCNWKKKCLLPRLRRQRHRNDVTFYCIAMLYLLYVRNLCTTFSELRPNDSIYFIANKHPHLFDRTKGIVRIVATRSGGCPFIYSIFNNKDINLICIFKTTIKKNVNISNKANKCVWCHFMWI